MDQRNILLADQLLDHSLKLQEDERILIDVSGTDTYPLAEALIEAAYQRGAQPFLSLSEARLSRALLKGASISQMEKRASWELAQMKEIDAYVAVRGGINSAELSDVPPEKMKLFSKAMSDVLRERVDRTRWVVLRYPTASMAQQAEMSTSAFEDFYYRVCTLDYAKMDKAMDALIARLEKADQVHIIAPGTDLRFSIKDIPAIKCAGECNIPDGEVFTAPVRTSVEGTITYNTPSRYRGQTFENISLTFEQGKIITASANHTEAINHIFDTDDGARYIGEFAFGVNPYITKPMNDILFDEKIAGSIHFTPGACYEEAPNGNQSDIHWDLVLMMDTKHGGGSIYLDGVLIRQDGFFIPKDLQALNPDALK